MKKSVYIETTVISYLTARFTRDLVVAAHQQITREWWERALPQYEAFISPVVLEEIARGDVHAAKSRIEKVKDFPLVEVTTEVQALAELYFDQIQIPEKARADAYHLALATIHGLDFLVSWNCTHIVSGRVRWILEEIHKEQGLQGPILCTPEELMEE